MSLVPAPILGIRSDFQVSNQNFSSDLIQSYLQVEELGIVHLRGHATAKGRLILRSASGPFVSDITEWSFTWEGIFCAWVIDFDDPSLHGFRPDVVEGRPNRIREINGHLVRIEDENLLRPLLIPLTRFYLGRHARLLFPAWPTIDTNDLGWGTLLLPPW